MSFVIELHDEPLTTEDHVAKGDGRHLVREGPDDTGVYVHVKDGTVTGYSAMNTFLSYTSDNKEVGWRI
ncbi:MAG TPA: hypothetical protein VIH71_07710 [Solirubrobacteraceae bacterium]